MLKVKNAKNEKKSQQLIALIDAEKVNTSKQEKRRKKLGGKVGILNKKAGKNSLKMPKSHHSVWQSSSSAKRVENFSFYLRERINKLSKKGCCYAIASARSKDNQIIKKITSEDRRKSTAKKFIIENARGMHPLTQTRSDYAKG